MKKYHITTVKRISLICMLLVMFCIWTNIEIYASVSIESMQKNDDVLITSEDNTFASRDENNTIIFYDYETNETAEVKPCDSLTKMMSCTGKVLSANDYTMNINNDMAQGDSGGPITDKDLGRLVGVFSTMHKNGFGIPDYNTVVKINQTVVDAIFTGKTLCFHSVL